MAKRTAILISLIGSAIAQLSRSCEHMALDASANVLSADCVPRNQSSSISSSLDLNGCFGYDGTQITATYHGNFGASCNSCRLYTAPDPWYGTVVYWIGCTCTGQSAEAAINIEVASAHQYVVNTDGQLTC